MYSPSSVDVVESALVEVVAVAPRDVVADYCGDLTRKERVISTAKKPGALWQEMNIAPKRPMSSYMLGGEENSKSIGDDYCSDLTKTDVVKCRRVKKTKRDPDAPKRPMSSYMLWLQENRKSIGDEYCSDLTGKERVISTVKKAGVLWQAMADDEKAPFVDKAVELKNDYKELMEEYKPIAGTKVVRAKYDVEEIPEAPIGWKGPFEKSYLKRKVKGKDGKTVRIQKVFSKAVDMATEINAAWTAACEEGDMPSHWSDEMKPCSGITKTSTGYDLRFGVDLVPLAVAPSTLTTSWVFGYADEEKADDDLEETAEQYVKRLVDNDVPFDDDADEDVDEDVDETVVLKEKIEKLEKKVEFLVNGHTVMIETLLTTFRVLLEKE